ncbi:MAG: hypothetical protein M1274_06890 [Actinobacteria bacterium]|nr:hypothetical protein [Actinomycetota bacterium]
MNDVITTAPIIFRKGDVVLDFNFDGGSNNNAPGMPKGYFSKISAEFLDLVVSGSDIYARFKVGDNQYIYFAMTSRTELIGIDLKKKYQGLPMTFFIPHEWGALKKTYRIDQFMVPGDRVEIFTYWSGAMDKEKNVTINPQLDGNGVQVAQAFCIARWKGARQIDSSK